MPAIPINTIAIWHSSIATIPAGWALCDGNSGTPDLRDQFIIGAGDSFAPNDSGGSQNHTHDFTSDGHTHTLGITSFNLNGTGLSNVTDSDVVAGTTDPASVLPPYFSLPYIMRI